MLLCLCGKHHKVAGDKETWAYKGTFVVSVWWRSGYQSLMPLPKDWGTPQHGEHKSCFAPIYYFSNVTVWWNQDRPKNNNQKRSKVKVGWCLMMFVYMEIWRGTFYRSAFMLLLFYMKSEGKGSKVVFSCLITWMTKGKGFREVFSQCLFTWMTKGKGF